MLKKLIVPMVVAVLLMAAADPVKDETPVPLDPYPCHRAAGPIAVDGKLDEAAWREAEPITAFYLLEPRDIGSLPAATVRLLWDDAFLYVAFEYTDDDIWSYSNTPDDELWNGDVAEFFIKPKTDERFYYEFVMAPNGALFDAKYPSRGAGGYLRFRSWSSNAQIATTIRGTDNNDRDNDQGYTVELAIPVSAFPESVCPKEAATWTFGAFRYDYSKSYEDPLLMMSIPKAVGHGYHSYEYYQPLHFVK